MKTSSNLFNNLQFNHKILNISFNEINSSILVAAIYLGEQEKAISVVTLASFDELDETFNIHQSDIATNFVESDEPYDDYDKFVEIARKEINGGVEIIDAFVSIYDVAMSTRVRRDDNTTFEDIELTDLNEYVLEQWTRTHAKNDTIPSSFTKRIKA